MAQRDSAKEVVRALMLSGSGEPRVPLAGAAHSCLASAACAGPALQCGSVGTTGAGLPLLPAGDLAPLRQLLQRADDAEARTALLNVRSRGERRTECVRLRSRCGRHPQPFSTAC